MKVKTLFLNGKEVQTRISGAFTAIRNDSADVLYLSETSGIVPDADGVISVPAGCSVTINDDEKNVYLLGNGKVILMGMYSDSNPFKTSAQSGGSGADEVARAAIEKHSGNTVIHVTDAEKASWNAKPDTADGGNAAMLAGHTASDFVLNENLPIVTYSDSDIATAAIEVKHDNIRLRLQIQTDIDTVRLFKSSDHGTTWTVLPLGNASTLQNHSDSDFVLQSDFNALVARVNALGG